MAVFEYKGLDARGKAVTGIIDADNAKVARARLRKQSVFPTEVRAQAQAGKSGGAKTETGKGLNREIDLAKYLQFITTRDVSVLTTQMAVLVGASVPMGETLHALVDQAEKSKLKIILSQIKERVNEGSGLAEAMKDHPRVFDDLYVQMVRAGEKSGSLDVVLRRLAEFTESNVKLQGKVASALAYPILMAIVGTVMLAGLFLGVIPRIRSLFDSFGGEKALPLITRAVFLLGDTLTSWWILVPVLTILVSAVVFRRWVRTESGRRRFDDYKLRVPLFGKVNRLVAVSRFCRTLGTLLASGVPIVNALHITRDVVGNVVIASAIQKAADNIQEGQSISVPLRQSGQFPPMVTHMIAIGEKTGELERMLKSVSDAYDDEVDATMSALTSMLGPLMIVLMGGVIFLVAIGLLLPMMNISSMIR